MILVTHAILGGAIGAATGNPFLAFFTGFISHFVLDAIPHWDYHISSGRTNSETDFTKNDIVINKESVGDILKIGLDFFGGIIIAYLLFRNGNTLDWAVLLGALGGTTPDFMQFLYYKLRLKPLFWLQKFHLFMHAEKSLKHYPILGASVQAIFIIGLGVLSLWK